MLFETRAMGVQRGIFASGVVAMLACATMVGCEAGSTNAAKNKRQEISRANAFAPDEAGSLRGKVLWSGKLPQAASLTGWSNPVVENGPRQKIIRSNPNVPLVDGKSRGVANALVFLEGVRPDVAKPWDHPPVLVEMRDYRFRVLQGGIETGIGLVQLGDTVEMVSRDPFFHALHLDGAAFFSLTFPDRDQPLKRKMEKPGGVELTSAAGYFWMRGYFMVTDHPYVTSTDKQGRFALNQIPPGKYNLACWLPSWHEERHERDPETGLVTRLFFRPAVTKRVTVEIQRSSRETAEFTWRLADFAPRWALARRR
jgi:hypothetical protein